MLRLLHTGPTVGGSGLVKAVRESQCRWSMWCEQQPRNWSALVGGFLDDLTCRIGSDSSVRAAVAVQVSRPAHKKRHGNREGNPPELVPVVSMITHI